MAVMPSSPIMVEELAAIELLEADLAQGEGAKFRKRTSWQAYQKKRADRGPDDDRGLRAVRGARSEPGEGRRQAIRVEKPT